MSLVCMYVCTYVMFEVMLNIIAILKDVLLKLSLSFIMSVESVIGNRTSVNNKVVDRTS